MWNKILAILATIGAGFSAIFFVLFKEAREQRLAEEKENEELTMDIDSFIAAEMAEKKKREENEELKEKAFSGNNLDAFKECKIAVYPDRNGRWRVQSLPVSKANRFKNRCSAPVEWRGLNDVELDKVTGLSKTTFIHKSGFTGGAETYEVNLELAKLWLEKGVEG